MARDFAQHLLARTGSMNRPPSINFYSARQSEDTCPRFKRLSFCAASIGQSVVRCNETKRQKA
jgi:hypothetical protein